MGTQLRLDPPMSLVVTALRRSDGPAHVLDLMRRTGLASGTLYASLVRLRRAGWIAAEWDASSAEATTESDLRRSYALTAAGRHPESPVSAMSRPMWLIAASWLAVGAIAAVQVAQTLSRTAADRLADLAVYMGAVTGLRSGHSLYDFVRPGGAGFTYPPLAGLIFWPLTVVPTVAAQTAWTLMTIAVVFALSAVLARATGVATPLIAAAGLLSAPVSSDLRFGQVSLALVALVVLDVALLGHRTAHGAFIGLAAAMKLTPLVFVPMLWASGRRRAAILAAGVFATCGAFAYADLPTDSWRYWTTAMWHIERLGHVATTGNQSVNGALMRLGLADPARSLVAFAVALAVLVIALRRAAWAARTGDWLSAVIIAGSASIVVSPVSWTHHQAWLVMGALLPIRGSAGARRAWVVVILAVMTLPVTTVGAVLGWPILTNARLLAALCIACWVPISARPRPGASDADQADGHCATSTSPPNADPRQVDSRGDCPERGGASVAASVAASDPNSASDRALSDPGSA